MPNAPAATPRAAAAASCSPATPRRCRRSAIARDLGLPRSSTYHLLERARSDEGFVVHLPEAAPLRARRRPRTSSAPPTSRQEPLRWIAQTVLTRLVAATTHNAHLAVLHGRDVLYVIEERAPGPAGAGDRRRRPAARAPDRERAGDARRAAAAAGRRAVPQPPRARRAATTPARPRSPSCARCSRRARRRRPRRGGRVRHARVRLASPAPVLDHTGHPIAAVAVTYPAGEGDAPALAVHVRRSAALVSARINPARTPPRPATTASARAATPA